MNNSNPTDTSLISFEHIPLGARFRYVGSNQVWTVINKYRKVDGKRLFGTIAAWEPDMLKRGKWIGQSICAHLPDDQDGDCPEMVIGID